jgi:hypothetical protein
MMTAKSQNAMGQIRRPTIASTAGEGWGLGPADGRITKAHGGEVQMIDRSIVRVHQHASGVKKRVEIAVWGEAAAGSPRKSTRGSPPRQTAPTPDYAGTSA